MTTPSDAKKAPDLQMLTLHEFAEKFSVSDYTVRKWIRLGQVNSTKIRNRHYISVAELRRIAEAKFGEDAP